MKTSKVINVDESSIEFRLDLERRVKLAQDLKNRIPLSAAKNNIISKYQKLVHAKV